MRCSLFSSDGPLMSEGTCEMTGGEMQMVATRWHLTPTVGGEPLTLVTEDGKQHHVIVQDVHVAKSDAEHGHTEVYRLALMDNGDDEPEERRGLFGGLKSLFNR